MRIIRDPQFGRLGQVVGLPPELTKIETKAKSVLLQVEFSDNAVVTIPRANVEIIEG